MPALPRLFGTTIDQAFYYDTPHLTGRDAGELLRAEPMTAYLTAGVPLPARAWRMLYRSTSATGEPRAVSGTLLLPRGRRSSSFPLVGFAIGTHGMGDNAAPSRLLARGLDYEAASIALVLARGWAVAITDYEGLGTPGDHPYVVGRALGPNVLDSMRAARQLRPDQLPADGPAAVIGYSEGGHAAGWAGQLQPTYAPDIPLTGLVCGAPPADPLAGGQSLDGSIFSFFAGYGLIGYAAAYPELELEGVLTPRGRQITRRLRDSSVLAAAIRGPHGASGAEMTSPNVLDHPQWRARFIENRLGSIAPEAPTLIHHSPFDRVVRYSQGTTLWREWKALGADVSLRPTREALDHATGGLVGTRIGTAWLARRFAGRPSRRRASNVVPLRRAA